MAQLEARKDVLEAQLAQGEDVKVAVHPHMASIYRDRVANLREALTDEDCQAEAAEIMRTLIDKIVLTPVGRDGKETRRPCRSPCMATWLASSAWPQKPKGRSMRATLW
jgi:hypothetical protein